MEGVRGRRRSPTGPKEAKSKVLSIEEEAIIVAFRHHYAIAARRLPLCAAADHPASDAVISASPPPAPRHQPDCRRSGGKPLKRNFYAYWIGYFHTDLAELQTAEGKLYLYVAIDRTSKFTFVQLVKKTSVLPSSKL